MKRVGIPNFFYPQVISHFEYFLRKERGAELFPQIRVKAEVKAISYYIEITRMANQKFAALENERRLNPSAEQMSELFLLLSAKYGINGSEKLELEQPTTERPFEVGDIVNRVFPRKAEQVKYGHLEWRVDDFDGHLVCISSVSTTSRRKVIPRILKLAEKTK